MEGLGLPEASIYASVPEGITVVTLATDQECAQAIEAGRKDFVAYVTSETVVDANIAAGLPILKLDGAVFSEDLAAAFDKSGSLDNTSLVAAVSAAITAMHSDGRLSELSNNWFGMDITKVP
jgi:ABC-type amino acid transport substrate-binding protein